MPVPKYSCQKWFTATRAVSGLAGLTIHLARPSRFIGKPGAMGGRKAGTPAVTFSLGLSYWPRPSTKVSRGFFISAMIMTVGIASSSLSFSFRRSFSCA